MLFHFLIWSGVFERHPRLKFVMTEQGSSWVVGALAQLDSQYELPMFRHLRRKLPRKPSEYYHQNAYIGAAFMDDTSATQRYEIGVDKLMWGSDYPHIEGTWPHTAEKLSRAFADVPRAEVAKMLGETAAKVYGFDVPKLSSLVAQIGPERVELGR